MSELGRSLSKVTITLLVKTGEDGKMFGSVTAGTIADALKTQLDVALDKKRIHLERPIQSLGEFDIELRLHPEVKCSVKVVVNSNTPIPSPEEVAKSAPQKTEKRSARGGTRKPAAESVNG